jgi:two-component system sensor histidine kinase BaeS
VGFREDGAVVLEVADSGPGIDPAHLERIFDRFARAEGHRARRSGGTGLGLPIAKALVEAHGGQVTVRSEPGAGAVFRIRIPGFVPRREDTAPN